MKRLEKGRFKWPKPTADMFCVHLCCMAHARRKFNDALKALDKCNLEKEEIRTSIANQAINLIAKLYAVEKEIRTREDDGNPMTSDEIFNIRQEKSKPVLLEIKDRLKYWKQIVTPRSKTGEAVNYFLNQYEQLSRYISDGRLPIDNNIVENNIRPFTLSRRNWLFNDTADGAEASAIMFSVIRTAIANNLDPYWYLRYLLDNLLNLKTKEDFSAFMPQNVTKEQLISYKEQILAYENSLMARI